MSLKRLEKEKFERERFEAEKLEQERFLKEKEQLEAQRAEMERLEVERVIKEREMQRRLLKAKEEQEAAQKDNLAKQKLKIEEEQRALENQQRLERERRLKEENERLEKELAEKDKLQQEIENQRIQKELLAKENARLEKAKQELEAERQQEAKKRLSVVQEEDEDEQLLQQRIRQQQFKHLVDEDSYTNFNHLNPNQQERKSKIETDLKDLCENFNYLKEKISQVGEIGQNERDTRLLILNLEKELKLLDVEARDLSVTCGLAVESTGNDTSLNDSQYLLNVLDQTTLTQFDLIKSFSTYLSAQLEQKNRDHQLKVNKKVQLAECEQNLLKYVELAIKFYKRPDCDLGCLEEHFMTKLNQSEQRLSYVQSIGDLDTRIASISSIEDSINGCLKQMSEAGSSACQTQIENLVMQPLSTHCADLKKFSLEWKQFDEEFTCLRRFLTEEIRIEELIKSGDKLPATPDPTALQNELIKCTNQRQSLLNQLTESEDLFARGCSLFDASLGQRLCVLVPNAAKEFNDTRDMVKEACRLLDDKCTCIDYVLKSQERIKELEYNIAKIKCDLDYMESEPLESGSSQTLAEAKNKLEMLANYKLQFKSITDEKEMLLEMQPNKSKTASSSLEALNRKFNYESRQKLEKSFNEIALRFINLEVNLNFYIINSF